MTGAKNGKLLVGTPRAVTAFVVSKVNAPMRTKLTAFELAEALKEHDFSVAQLDCFFWEVPVKDQRDFARAHGLGEVELRRAAHAYGQAMKRHVPLLTGEPSAWERVPESLPEGMVRLPPSEPDDAPILSLHDMPGARHPAPVPDLPAMP